MLSALRNHALTCLLLGISSLFATGCEVGVPAVPDAGTEKTDVSVQFLATVNGSDFECGGLYDGLGADRFSLIANDLRFFIHDLQLLTSDGDAVDVKLDQAGPWQHENVALLDFEDGGIGCPFGTSEVNSTVTGRVPEGQYTGVRFTLGVPFDLNHENQATAEAPLNLTSMFWSWNGGYKFLRLDGEAPGLGAVALHLGSTGCEGTSDNRVSDCNHRNRVTIELADVDVRDRAVVFDIASLLSRTRADEGFCMSDRSDPACNGPFVRLGLMGGEDQQVFSTTARRDEVAGDGDPDGGAADASVEDCHDKQPAKPYAWNLPPEFPEPHVPDDNAMSQAKVELGRRLFWDKRLSLNGTQSCGSCHEPSLGFADGKPQGVGSTGQVHRRSSMSLTNVAYSARFTWGNPLIASLEEQALGPLFGETPVELGWAGREKELLKRVGESDDYAEQFEKVFGSDCEPVSVDHIAKAIAAFERTLISGTSAYDRFWFADEEDALSDDAFMGLALFNSERFECFHCHGSVNFSSNSNISFDEPLFTNTGLYDVDGKGAYPKEDQGVVEISEKPEDMGKFKPPTLRNIEHTAPYMHDGSLETLDDVLDHYAAGGQARSDLTSSFMLGFEISAAERRQLKAFLRSLSDEAFLEDPRFQDPF